jgi:hypothetical protein
VNARGGAAVEAVVTTGFLIALIGATLCAAYAAFARAYLEYRAEQALYCLGERRPPPVCGARLRSTIQRTLAYGRLGRLTLIDGRDAWRVRFEWRLGHVIFRLDKALSRRRVLKKDLSR